MNIIIYRLLGIVLKLQKLYNNLTITINYFKRNVQVIIVVRIKRVNNVVIGDDLHNLHYIKINLGVNIIKYSSRMHTFL